MTSINMIVGGLVGIIGLVYLVGLLIGSYTVKGVRIDDTCKASERNHDRDHAESRLEGCLVLAAGWSQPSGLDGQLHSPMSASVAGSYTL